MKSAQIFISPIEPVSRASILLKTAGLRDSGYFTAGAMSLSIDSLNFSRLQQGDNKIIAYDIIADYTGNGYIQTKTAPPAITYASVYYPVSFTGGGYRIWVRCATPSAASFSCEVMIDGGAIGTVDSGAIVGWEWLYIDIGVLSGSHELGLKPVIDGLAIDKICIVNNMVDIITGSGPSFTESPFVTLHSMVYKVVADVPTDAMYIYDYITSLEEVRSDGWYSVDLNFLDPSLSDSFTDKSALVVFSAGSDNSQYIIWSSALADAAVIPSATYS